jgi:hypothetical protein
MKKTKNSNYHRNGIELPAIINMETLSYASDEDLERHVTYLQAERDRAARSEYDLRPWEVEICYLQRELKIRNDRRIAHERYLRTHPEANFYVNNATEEDVAAVN